MTSHLAMKENSSMFVLAFFYLYSNAQNLNKSLEFTRLE